MAQNDDWRWRTEEEDERFARASERGYPQQSGRSREGYYSASREPGMRGYEGSGSQWGPGASGAYGPGGPPGYGQGSPSRYPQGQGWGASRPGEQERGEYGPGEYERHPGGFGQGYGQGWGPGPETVRGAGRGRFAGRGPKGYRRSDDRIREDVSDRLEQHPDIDASEIELDVREGVVTLTGTVEDRLTKRMVEDVTDSTPGVKDVQNQIRISQPARPEDPPAGAGASPAGRGRDARPPSGQRGRPR